MVVCHCERVNDRTIRKLIRDREVTVDDVIASCGAGGRCGGCRASIEQLLEAGASVRATVATRH
jgi:bacterioferritin-associated ferredoxin